MKKNIPPELDRIIDVVLAYKPKEKQKASKQRQKRKAKRTHVYNSLSILLAKARASQVTDAVDHQEKKVELRADIL